MSRPLALAFVGWRTAVLIGVGLLRIGGRIPDRGDAAQVGPPGREWDPQGDVGFLRGVRPPTDALVRFIAGHKARFGVEPICRVLSQQAGELSRNIRLRRCWLDLAQGNGRTDLGCLVLVSAL